MQRDIAQFAATKLQGGWSAADFSKYLNKDTLKELLPKFEKFEPLVRVRILLSLLTLDTEAKVTLHEELQGFIAAAREDKEEWVSITAKALGNLTLPLDFQAMLAGTTIVRDTLKDLQTRLQDGDNSSFRPLEESYLSTRIVEDARGGPEPAIQHSHFIPREGANGSVPEMYSRVKASAAMVASSLPTASGASSPYHSSFPMPRQTEGGEAVSKPPGVPAGGAAEGPSRQSGATEIFRTNRHSSLGSASRQLPAASSGQERRSAASVGQERKGVSRPVNVKLLDVSEVQKLNGLDSRKKQNQAVSPESSQIHGNQAGQSVGTEEGELEAGELCAADSFPEHTVKRMRVAHEAVV